MNVILDGLISYGFSKKQAKIYLAVLKLGSAPGGTIARTSGVHRVTTYTILDDLKEKGVVRKMKRKGLYYFSVIEPAGLLVALHEKTKTLEGLLPSLEMLSQSIGSKPQIQYLEGFDGLTQMFTDFMTMKDDMRAILGNIDDHGDMLWKAAKEYYAFRIKKGYKLLQINTIDNIDEAGSKKIDKKYKRETVVLQKFNFPIKAYLNIYGPGKISIVFFDDNKMPHIIMIRSKEVYELARGLFEYIWENETQG